MRPLCAGFCAASRAVKVILSSLRVMPHADVRCVAQPLRNDVDWELFEKLGLPQRTRLAQTTPRCVLGNVSRVLFELELGMGGPRAPRP